MTTEQQLLTQKFDKLQIDNRYGFEIRKRFNNNISRNLKSSLLDAERYKEEYSAEFQVVSNLKKKLTEVRLDMEKTREDLKSARIEGAKPKYKHSYPKFNKDTKVNLDMSMWITHNITKVVK